MQRVSYIQYVLYYIVFVLLQIPFLYHLVLYDRAFAFFYVGFILLLPHGLNRSIAMLMAFATGLLIDVFSSTPGIHASACIFVAFIRDNWAEAVVGSSDDEISLSVPALGLWKLALYMAPLILAHHFFIFVIENGGFYSLGFLLLKIIFSTIYTLTLVVAISYIMSPRSRRT